MSYELIFDARALKEFQKLGDTIKKQFKKKLEEVLVAPKNKKNQLRELPNCYKIKLHQSGYRLIYQVDDGKLTVLVIAIGKRDREEAYKKADNRLKTS